MSTLEPLQHSTVALLLWAVSRMVALCQSVSTRGVAVELLLLEHLLLVQNPSLLILWWGQPSFLSNLLAQWILLLALWLILDCNVVEGMILTRSDTREAHPR